MKKAENLTAFTLIEVLIVTGIMGILVAITIPGFTQFSDRRLLDRNVKNVESAINSVRAKSISGVVVINGENKYNAQWGIKIPCTGDNNTYDLGYMLDTDEDGVYDNGTSYTATRTLSENVAFDCGKTDSPIFFTRFDGFFSDGKSLKQVTLTSGSMSTVINVYKSGKIELESI